MLGPLIVDVEGTSLTAEDREVLKHPAVGGVILFARNCPDADTVAALAAEIHAVREPRLLVSIDQEGGRVQRLKEGVTRLPAPTRMGALWDTDPRAARTMVHEAGWLMAAELLALDVDLSYAPVADLGGTSRVIGDRAFHTQPQAVEALTLAYVYGMREAGMRGVAKHFPGHGGVAEDSHVESPVDRREYGDLQMADLRPFEWLINNGVAAMMMSHVVYPAVAPEPASLSRRWVHEILREQMGFQGAVIADDLSMHGAAGVGDTLARVRMALAAGCDYAPICNDRTAVHAVLESSKSLPNEPASGLRRSRLMPEHRPERAELETDPRLKAARALLAGLGPDPDFHLEA
ncbi:MAG: beta-N-acetylhexosaminidase [Gammaproteobacteria bacterium]